MLPPANQAITTAAAISHDAAVGYAAASRFVRGRHGRRESPEEPRGGKKTDRGGGHRGHERLSPGEHVVAACSERATNGIVASRSRNDKILWRKNKKLFNSEIISSSRRKDGRETISRDIRSGAESDRTLIVYTPDVYFLKSRTRASVCDGGETRT